VHTAQNSSDDQAILNNVSGSAEDAQKALDELIKFIKQTPLSTQQDGTCSTVSYTMYRPQSTSQNTQSHQPLLTTP